MPLVCEQNTGIHTPHLYAQISLSTIYNTEGANTPAIFLEQPFLAVYNRKKSPGYPCTLSRFEARPKKINVHLTGGGLMRP